MQETGQNNLGGLHVAEQRSPADGVARRERQWGRPARPKHCRFVLDSAAQGTTISVGRSAELRQAACPTPHPHGCRRHQACVLQHRGSQNAPRRWCPSGFHELRVTSRYVRCSVRFNLTVVLNTRLRILRGRDAEVIPKSMNVMGFPSSIERTAFCVYIPPSSGVGKIVYICVLRACWPLLACLSNVEDSLIVSTSCMMYARWLSSQCPRLIFPYCSVSCHLQGVRSARMGCLSFLFLLSFLQAGWRRAGISRSTIYLFFLAGVIIYLLSRPASFSQAVHGSNVLDQKRA